MDSSTMYTCAYDSVAFRNGNRKPTVILYRTVRCTCVHWQLTTLLGPLAWSGLVMATLTLALITMVSKATVVLIAVNNASLEARNGRYFW